MFHKNQTNTIKCDLDLTTLIPLGASGLDNAESAISAVVTKTSWAFCLNDMVSTTGKSIGEIVLFPIAIPQSVQTCIREAGGNISPEGISIPGIQGLNKYAQSAYQLDLGGVVSVGIPSPGQFPGTVFFAGFSKFSSDLF